MIFQTLDSGAREEYASGMRRDTETGKPRFDLMWPEGVPYSEQFITRFALLLARGAEKYGDRNWEKGDSQVELGRARSSAARHFAQWLSGEEDEDHASAVLFNLLQAETLKWKLSQQYRGLRLVVDPNVPAGEVWSYSDHSGYDYDEEDDDY